MPRSKTVAIIPARYASTRFPGKPLVMIGGQSMIERVYRQAQKAKCLGFIIVATDDDRIKKHVEAFGGFALMTSVNHQSGTDRCAEIIEKTNGQWKVIINIQGDEPFINPGQIDSLVHCFDDDETQIATLVKKITDQSDLNNSNIPKVAVGNNGNALYFSRACIPFNRSEKEITFYKHVGIYGYRINTLKAIAKLQPGTLELTESLEQLRWLENGYSIKTAITEYENVAVDNPGDLDKIKSLFNL